MRKYEELHKVYHWACKLFGISWTKRELELSEILWEEFSFHHEENLDRWFHIVRVARNSLLSWRFEVHRTYPSNLPEIALVFRLENFHVHRALEEECHLLKDFCVRNIRGSRVLYNNINFLVRTRFVVSIIIPSFLELIKGHFKRFWKFICVDR